MKPAKLKLPSFAAFKRMTISQRTAVFTRWVKSKPASRTYDYWNEKNCPLARFGQAITRSRLAEGGGSDFWYRDQWYAVFGRYLHVVSSSDGTYGGILKGFAAHQAAEETAPGFGLNLADDKTRTMLGSVVSRALHAAK